MRLKGMHYKWLFAWMDDLFVQHIMHARLHWRVERERKIWHMPGHITLNALSITVSFVAFMRVESLKYFAVIALERWKINAILYHEKYFLDEYKLMTCKCHIKLLGSRVNFKDKWRFTWSISCSTWQHGDTFFMPAWISVKFEKINGLIIINYDCDKHFGRLVCWKMEAYPLRLTSIIEEEEK